MTETPLGELIRAISQGLAQPRHTWQAVVIALAVLGAMALARVGARLLVRRQKTRAAVLGEALAADALVRVRRVLRPLLALALLWVGEGLLRLSGVVATEVDIRLLRLAAWLLGTLAVVRVLFALMRRVLRSAILIVSLERSITALAILFVGLYALGMLGDVLAWLESVQIPLGRAQSVSLASILMGSATTLGALLLAMWLGALVEERLGEQTTLDPNLRTVLGRSIRALLLVFAALFALELSGFDLTILSVFGGALGVGLGLGLQRIASNYVSGFILLLEHSVRIGDIITVDKYAGQVDQVKTRCTVLRQGDGTEAIVPNEMLVSMPVVNSTLSNAKVAVVLPVMIGPKADASLAQQLLCEAARSQPRVLAGPAPVALLVEFRGGNLALELTFWICDPKNGTQNVRSDVSMVALERFRAHNIELAAPRSTSS